ncbi:MAG TPA: hypothetical protein VGT06_09920 [Candidatus Methylomirabilis sp.]|jgi:hypothetical protein|nr:hypothetical protein [Candidatus Methylomirabilis sp.]
MAEGEERAVTAFGQPFAGVFPQLADAQVEWEVQGHALSRAPTGVGRGLRMSVKAGYFQGTIRCGQPGCAGGGFEVDQILQLMVQDGEEEREGLLVCGGWVGGPEGEERSPCINAIRYRIQLTYRKGSGGLKSGDL